MKHTPWLILTVLFLISCGKKDDGSELNLASGSRTSVLGRASIGSQCPHGSISQPQSVALGLYNCAIDQDPLVLSEPPKTLMLQADCKKKWLNVRSMDRGSEKVDVMWEILPTGDFDMTVPGASVGIKNLEGEDSSCTSFTELRIVGKVDCTDRDRASISIEPVIWYLGRGKKPTNFGGTECRLPSGCYLAAETKLDQCI